MNRVERLVSVLVYLGLLAYAVLGSGCVRSVTTCITYDQAVGHVPADRYPTRSTGASVCAEVGPSE